MPFGRDKLPIEPPVHRRRLSVPGVSPADTELMPWNLIQAQLEIARGIVYLTNTKSELDNQNTPTPTPVITVLTPPDAVASGTAPIALQVTGSDFQDASKVWFNNVVQPTMYYSASKLVAEVHKLAIGYYPVVVKSGDKVSNTLQFRFR